MKLIIRDGFATLHGFTDTYELPSGSLEIIAEDGKTLFSIQLTKEGTIKVRGGHDCQHNGATLDDTLIIKPVACNVVELQRPIRKPL